MKTLSFCRIQTTTRGDYNPSFLDEPFFEADNLFKEKRFPEAITASLHAAHIDIYSKSRERCKQKKEMMKMSLAGRKG